jgi:hypothetical protein
MRLSTETLHIAGFSPRWGWIGSGRCWRCGVKSVLFDPRLTHASGPICAEARSMVERLC